MPGIIIIIYLKLVKILQLATYDYALYIAPALINLYAITTDFNVMHSETGMALFTIEKRR